MNIDMCALRAAQAHLSSTIANLHLGGDDCAPIRRQLEKAWEELRLILQKELLKA